MKKILIITNEMIPYSLTWGGCQRMYFLNNALIQAGYDVKLVALRSSPYNTFGKIVPDNCIFVEGKKEKIKETTTKNTDKKRSRSIIKPVAAKIDNLLFNEIQAGNGIKTYRRCLKARSIFSKLLSENKYDIVLISGPPFEIYSLAYYVKRIQRDIKVIIDYRDPWNLWHTGNCLCEFRERRLQQLADMIICTNSNMCIDLPLKFKSDKKKYYVVANGYSEDFPTQDELENARLPTNKLNLVYTGAISFLNSPNDYRNPFNLLKAFSKFIKEVSDEIHLTFVGVNIENTDLNNEIFKGIERNVTLLGPVNSTLAKAYIRNADVGVLIHNATDQSGRYLISGKLYDYIQMNRYIFSIGAQDSQHADLLQGYDIGINSTNNLTEIYSSLKRIYQMWKSNQIDSCYDCIDITEFSREAQVNKYLDLIEKVK